MTTFNFTGTVKFCPHCGGNVEERHVAGKPRPHCPSCRVTFYADPKLAVAVLVHDGERLVLQRRSIDPGMGRWSFPSGYVDRGEPVERAAVREVVEETGLEVRITELIGIYSQPGNPVVLAVYAANIVGGQLEAGDESDAVGAFDLTDLPELAFEHDGQIIADWRQRTGR
jgi:ADP-ribose pyrophosphatase YjhB (NUDIX family)